MKKILIELLARLMSDKESRKKIFIAVFSIAAGFLGLMMLPVAVLSGMVGIEPPEIDVGFDEAAFMPELTPERQEDVDRMNAAGTSIESAMAVIGLQEYTIKAQLIYMSYFDQQPLSDFADYTAMFAQTDDTVLIENLNSRYGIDINYEDFMRTYVMIMNATVNEYMFTNMAEKNSDDLAAWCRNAYVSGWGFQENSYGEMDSELRYRCADNVGLIMGYLRYSPSEKIFNTEIDTLVYTEIDSVDNMPDVQGVGVWNGTDFGIYIGSGEVVFSSAMGGIVREPLENGGWTSWCTFEGVSYPQTVTDRINEIQNPTEENTEEDTTENGE